MVAGRLRHQITIQEQTTTQDEYGQAIETWTAIATVRASIEPIRGKEYFSSNERNAEVTTKITIRHISGIYPNMRIIYQNKAYDIKDVINYQERNHMMELMCTQEIDYLTGVIFNGDLVTYDGTIVTYGEVLI